MTSSRPVVLVTGSSRGIGRAIAIDLAEHGYDPIVHFVRDENGAEETLAAVRAAGAEPRLLQFDISDREATRKALEADVDANGVYYGVVLNAGIARDGAFPMLTGDDWDRVIGTNLDGFYNVMHPLTMPLVRARRPARVVTLSSMSGLTGNRGQVNYSAAKAGIIGATKALAVELASRGITVNCVAPGLIETDMTDQLPVEQMLPLIPAGRVGQPHEVAAVVRFLMSEEAAYVTRQVIAVNGGMM